MFRLKRKTTQQEKCKSSDEKLKGALQVSIKTTSSESGMIEMDINSLTPTYFETDTFEGYALLIARTDPICPQYAEFLGDKITFEVQVQGKFKRIPSGRVFVGADSDYVLTLGVLLRGVVQLIIQFLSTFVSHVHYSLGHPLGTPDREITHLVAPLWSTMGSVVITPPNETPPPLGQTLPETAEQKSLRRQVDVDINLSNTYSFSMNSYNMDIISWNLIKVPLLQVIPLQTFTENTPINLVAYEVPVVEGEKYPIRHPIEKLNHIFKVKLSYFPTPGAAEEKKGEEQEQEQEEEREQEQETEQELKVKEIEVEEKEVDNPIPIPTTAEEGRNIDSQNENDKNETEIENETEEEKK